MKNIQKVNAHKIGYIDVLSPDVPSPQNGYVIPEMNF